MSDFVIKLIKLVSYYILSTGFLGKKQGFARKYFPCDSQDQEPRLRHENHNLV